MDTNKLIQILIPCFLALNANSETFKAEAPQDPDEQKKYGFGSIWPGKENFFRNISKKNQEKCQPSEQQNNNTLKPHQPTSKKKRSPKDLMWEAASQVLKPFSVSYANKDSGIIKTEEAGIPEFDTTNSCVYKITVNVTDTGKLSVHISSAEDSKTRIQKHEALLQKKITEVYNNISSKSN